MEQNYSVVSPGTQLICRSVRFRCLKIDVLAGNIPMVLSRCFDLALLGAPPLFSPAPGTPNQNRPGQKLPASRHNAPGSLPIRNSRAFPSLSICAP